MSMEMRADLARWRLMGQPVARISVSAARGSTPREAGTFMLVTASGQSGTVGGGDLEWSAIHHARALLASGGQAREMRIDLGGRSGQCCGGEVMLFIDVPDGRGLDGIMAELERQRREAPLLLLFGAGHVGRALAHVLAPLPLRLAWCDSRPHEFGPVIPAGVDVHDDGDWQRLVTDAPAGSGALVLTQSHALDSVIVASILERGDFRYVGLIGSHTKRRRFELAFRALGLPEDRINAMVCPIGGQGVRDKRPPVIAALVAAEIVTRFLHAPQEDGDADGDERRL
ncbi:xanthine dehydrogenase accessory protein XdhC [Komagataeibacter nataicola]|uniref:Xanthine dehydrogenase accessory protein XdhC n=1 Tax=Komagataeibacter nataicola TaxID=265960 RepID=A0A9N7CZ44_9PROT|nr:xanthine dehydrogenase accessory protein XdhC [Komagataeibacter nataicola]AQU88321.1 xanthine dehydrogenase accessory protein XdhC [Komagataeibacter nataicola]PYD67621.1 xanthine dehydrogenase accessory protein XdhC [Komagataeibacter nataicola]WEQ54572.1 xanthine dehydrogenase accessory protein XdhC [Komagataeibacter nataicola]